MNLRHIFLILITILPLSCGKKLTQEEIHKSFLNGVESYYKDKNATEILNRENSGTDDRYIRVIIFDQNGWFLNGITCDNKLESANRKGITESECGFKNYFYYMKGSRWHKCLKCGRQFDLDNIKSPRDVTMKYNIPPANVIKTYDPILLVDDTYVTKIRFLEVFILKDRLTVFHHIASGIEKQTLMREARVTDMIQNYSVKEQEFEFDGHSVTPKGDPIELFTLNNAPTVVQ